MLWSMIALVMTLLTLYNLNLYYGMYQLDQTHNHNHAQWQLATFDYNDPMYTYNIDMSDDLIMSDITLNYIKSFFKDQENETMLYLYGYKKDNKTFIERAEYISKGIILTNQTAVGFLKSNASDALGYIHVHPNYSCMLSGGDLIISDTHNQIIALYCVDKILWYDGTYHLQNITGGE
jgi:proteasome lid subunit RPN8/RPN11